MRYWWVNQNQTYRHELRGGYLWSPKRNDNSARNPFYESMREVAPEDLIFQTHQNLCERWGYCREVNRLKPIPVRLKRRIPIGKHTTEDLHMIVGPHLVNEPCKFDFHLPSDVLPVLPCISEFLRLGALPAIRLCDPNRERTMGTTLGAGLHMARLIGISKC
jgi:hypothetical protein